MNKHILDINVVKLIEKYTQHKAEEIINILLNSTKTTIYCDVDKQKRINIWLSYVHILTKNKLIKYLISSGRWEMLPAMKSVRPVALAT